MSKFNINGWVKETNKIIEIQVEASSVQNAEATAEQMGIKVSKIIRIRENHLEEFEQTIVKSPTSRVAYILTGILIGFLLGIYGVHNLIAGYKRNGLIQLGISLFCWFNLVIGMFLIIPLCIAFPLWFGLLIWTLVESCTIKVDSQGRTMM